MARRHILACIVLQVLLNVSICYSLSLEVDNTEQGNDIPTCLTENGPPCRSLEYVIISNITHNLIVTVVSKLLVLSNPITLSHVTNVTLQGSPTTAVVISCRFNNADPNRNGAGLQFISSFDINLLNFSMDNCTAKANMIFESDFHSLLIWNCTNVSIASVVISKSFGYGLSLANCDGNIVIDRCTFKQNKHQPYWNYTGGSSGLLVHINSSVGVHTAVYKIVKCIIKENTANLVSKQRWEQLENHGGGMFVLLLNGAVGNIIIINDCSFVNNHALLGGGLYFVCKLNCHDNNVEVSDSMFHNNIVTYGGGGIDLGYSSYTDIKPRNNSIQFVNCMFTKNRGQFGGGVALFSSTSVEIIDSVQINKIYFKACSFNNNKADRGAAVDINPGTEYLMLMVLTS